MIMTSITYAPIALFTYNRADHTKSVIESLLQNKEAKDSELYIFSDGPKTEEKRKAVEANRHYIHSITGFKSIHIIEHEENQGLANSLIKGITALTNKYGRVIVVEDDLILSPYFLQFMNEALDKYANDDRISAVSAFLNPIDNTPPNLFFLRYFACWGWGTWKRAWDLFNPDAKDLLRKLRWKKKDFNINNSCDFYGMLYCQKIGLVDSWAIRFYASSFLANKLVLFPGQSMASQTGFDGSGTHCENDNSIYQTVQPSSSPIHFSDIAIIENQEMYVAFSRFYRKGKEQYSFHNLYNQFKSFIRRLLGIDYK